MSKMSPWQNMKTPKCIFSDFDIYSSNLDPTSTCPRHFYYLKERRRQIVIGAKVSDTTPGVSLYQLAIAINNAV